MAVLSSALVDYIASRAHVMAVDDASATVRAIAARFGRIVDPKPDGRVHACDVTAGTVVSHASFEELRRDCERVVEHARDTNELLLVVTDILFDTVDWDGRRNT